MILSLLSCLFLVMFLASCVFLVVTLVAIKRFVGTFSVQRRSSGPQLPVTVLKPLHGLDFNLAENLRSFCQQDYPECQVIFGVQSPDDPALPVAEAVLREFPHLNIRIVVDEGKTFRNLKVNNLNNMVRFAENPWIVIADADMRVKPDYLSVVTAPLTDPAVGAVTSLYRGVSEDRMFWSFLGALHINYDFLPQALLGHHLDLGDGCYGATIALSRATLDRVGGFAAIGNHLADDHALGQAIRNCGLRVKLAPCLVDTVVHEPTFTHLLAHELRWGKTVLGVQPLGYVGSILTHPIPLALFAAAAFPVWGALALVLSAVGLRWLAVRTKARAFHLPVPNPLAILVRDLLSFFVFVLSFFPQKLVWRDHKFTSLNKGIIVQSEEIGQS